MDRTTNGLPWAVSRKLLVRQCLPLPVWFQPLGGQLALSPLLFLVHPPAPYHFRGKPPFWGVWTFCNSSHNSQQPAIQCLQKAGSWQGPRGCGLMLLKVRLRWESSVRPRAGQRPLRAAPKWGRASSGNRKQVKCLIHSFSAFFVSGTILGLGYNNEENQWICLWKVYSILGKTNHKPININKECQVW